MTIKHNSSIGDVALDFCEDKRTVSFMFDYLWFQSFDAKTQNPSFDELSSFLK